MGRSFPYYSYHTNEGFTFLELIIVIVLLSILAVFSVSRWATGINPNAQAQQLANDIRYTQSLAMTNNSNRYRVNLITTSPNGYSISTTAGTIIPSSITNNNTVTLGTSISYGAFTNLPNNVIAFDGLGIPYTNTTATTALTATASIPITSGGITITIQISPTTGNVTVL